MPTVAIYFIYSQQWDMVHVYNDKCWTKASFLSVRFLPGSSWILYIYIYLWKLYQHYRPHTIAHAWALVQGERTGKDWCAWSCVCHSRAKKSPGCDLALPSIRTLCLGVLCPWVTKQPLLHTSSSLLSFPTCVCLLQTPDFDFHDS